MFVLLKPSLCWLVIIGSCLSLELVVRSVVCLCARL